MKGVLKMDKILKKSLLLLFILILFEPIGKVRCEEKPPVEASEKVIYLTFDDGPGGKTTTRILDTLKDENVPGTFFVIGDQIDNQEDIILRMKNEGHSIGLHSFSHNRNILYRSSGDFIAEMEKVQKRLYDVTGENYYILRFPFGCNNMTYKLTSGMVDAVHTSSFKIYDWTQDTLDGANPTSSPSTILQRAISDKDTVILLMHCAKNNKNSAAALPGIIKYYKDHGYTFKKITPDTKEIYKITKR
jgi:peptidoglycan/xylan/chitin deacetylase (PgdA/CDA1 family)